MKQFTALCIGGPMAGQYITREEPVFECVEGDELSDMIETFGEIKDHAYTTSTYKWVLIGAEMGAGEEFTIWMHDTLNTVAEALVELLRAYSQQFSKDMTD